MSDVNLDDSPGRAKRPSVSEDWHHARRPNRRLFGVQQRWLLHLRPFLVPRNFILLAVAVSAYLFAFNSLGLSALDLVKDVARRPRRAASRPAAIVAESDADVHGEPREDDDGDDGSRAGGTASSRLLDEASRRASMSPAAATPPPDHPDGLQEAACKRFKELGVVRPVQQLGQASSGGSSSQRSSRVLLLTSSWGLPPSARFTSHASSNARGDTDVLLRAAAANLANPWVLAVHVFVPPSLCAERLADEYEVADAAASAAAAAAVASSRRPSKKKGGGDKGGKSGGDKGGKTGGVKGGKGGGDKGGAKKGGTKKGGGGGGKGGGSNSTSSPATGVPTKRLLFATPALSSAPATSSPTSSIASPVSASPGGSASTASASRVRLIVGKRGDAPPAWDALLRYAAAAQAAAPFVAIMRADVIWPRGFNCISAKSLLKSGSALALSCQAHLQTCAPLVASAAHRGGAGTPPTATSTAHSTSASLLAASEVAGGGSMGLSELSETILSGGPSAAAAANWSSAYWACRERHGHRSTLACIPLLDQCFKYSGVQHAIVSSLPHTRRGSNAFERERNASGACIARLLRTRSLVAHSQPTPLQLYSCSS